MGPTFNLIAFFLLVANLRPALTSVGPLLDAIRLALGLSGTAAGTLMSVPLVTFAIAAPLARLGRTRGIERTLVVCVVVAAIGIVLRSQGSRAALFGGTVVCSIGIGIANILVPSLIKRDHPGRVGAMTTAYIVVMSSVGALATGLAVPLANILPGGWRGALEVWAVPAVVATACILPELTRMRPPEPASQIGASNGRSVWRSSVAWYVTAFMGLQSLVFYVLIGWIPQFLRDRGMSAEGAGWLLTLCQIVALVAGCIVPALLRVVPDQRSIAVTASFLTLLGLLGLLLEPTWAGLWLALLGVSTGITVILAFALIGMRSSDHHQAASLSMMSQATGYLIAATGPLAFGWLHDATGDWRLPMIALMGIALAQGLAGLGAGRNAHVGRIT